jgi:4-amino-4-deoxy-L-arabinose transferase-like glycosyltransferase
MIEDTVVISRASAIVGHLTVGWRPWALLLVLCFCLYRPGLASMPPLDRDEARFMQATRQMLESGDFLRIRFQDDARNKKPAGIYWLQAASVGLFSTPESNAAWPYRVPSLLGASAAVLLSFGFGARLIGRPAALLGAMLLASCILLVSEAHLAKTDAMLLATVVAAQGALGEIYRRSRAEEPGSFGPALVFWLAQGGGILLKGPVTPMVSVLTLAALCLVDRRWRWLGSLRPIWGIPLVIAVVGPWFLAIQSATGGAFASEAIGHDLLGKLVGAQETHGAPPGTYLLSMPVSFWPSSALLGLAALVGWRRRKETAERFLLAWIIPAWLIFELVPTKLPHYVLPLYPALALLAGQALVATSSGAVTMRRRWPDAMAFGLWTIVALALIIGLTALPITLGSGVAALSLLPAAATISFGVVLLRQFSREFSISAAPVIAVIAVLVFAPSFAVLLPGLDSLWLSRSAAEMVARHPPPPGSAVDTVGYSEPSLVFLLDGNTRAVAAEQAAADLAARSGALALVAGSDDETFRRALAGHGAQAMKLDETTGINYSRSFRLMALTLYTAVPG